MSSQYDHNDSNAYSNSNTPWYHLHGDCNVIVINYVVLKYNIDDMNCVLQ